MNILLVSFEFPPANATGGIGSYMYHLALLLARQGHSITIFSAAPSLYDLQVVNSDSYTNYLIPAKNNDEFRKAVVPVFDAFIQNKPVQVMESPEVGACALHIKQKYPGIPLIVKMHTPGVLITHVSNTYLPVIKKARFVLGALSRGRIDLGYWSFSDKNRHCNEEYKICMMADALLSPSRALKKWTASYWKIPADKIAVVPNPFSINDELFSLQVEGRPKVISFIGKLSILKGMRALTEALPGILRSHADCTIYIVGRDETENGRSMMDYMKSRLHHFSDRLIFTGKLDNAELKKIYGISRICVFPSLWENYPTVVLEAMAAGAAVAASNSGGIPELITDKKTGRLFHPLQPKQITRVINRLLDDEDECEALATNARKSLKDKMNNKDYLSSLLNCYTQYAK